MWSQKAQRHFGAEKTAAKQEMKTQATF